MAVYSAWLYLWLTYPSLGGGLLCLAISVVYQSVKVGFSPFGYKYNCGFTYPGLGGGLLCLAISVVYLPWGRWQFTLLGYICS